MRIYKCVAFTVLVLGVASLSSASFTIGTFQDPAQDQTTPLFTIDLDNDLITGQWNDDQTGLTLELPFIPTNYQDAFFTMTPVIYTGGLSGGLTGGGTIKFFADNTPATPVFRIDFDQAYINPYNYGASDSFEFFADGVVFSGLNIPSGLTNESFSFAFANQAVINDDAQLYGFTATASFTSSAVPEPLSMSLIALGALCLARRP